MARDIKARKAYQAEYIRKHYKENKQYYIDKAEDKRRAIIAYVRAYKQRPCFDCKIEYPYYVMQYDHLGDKEANLANIHVKGWSIERVQSEIDKCDVVCANCHAERTHKRRNGFLV